MTSPESALQPRTADLADQLQFALQTVREAYVSKHSASAAQHNRACQYLPGGSTRATVFYSPFPLTIERGEASWLWDIDGNRLLNCVGEYSAGIFGHDAALLNRILDEIRKHGLVLSGPTRFEAQLAELICQRFPSCELLRFCNSGTEANLFALSLARHIKKRSTTLVFQSSYHGGLLTFSDQPGALNAPLPVVIAPYNDVDATRQMIRQNAADLAAILVEPMLGSGGCIPGTYDFLQMLRDEATQHDIVLIFDEVLTSRLAPGGLQQLHGIKPDLTTFGKYMGGGFSFGAFGGSRTLMEKLDPRQPQHLPHAGTFNNNLASMLGGYISLTERLTPEAIIELNARGDRLREALNLLATSHGANVLVTGLGAVMNIHLTGAQSEIGRVSDPFLEMQRELLHLDLINRGIYLARRGLITLNLAMTAADTDLIAETFKAFLSQYSHLLAPIETSQ